MKRFLLACALGLGLSITLQAAETCSKTATRKNGDLPSCIAIDAVTTNATSATIDTFGYRELSAQIWSAAGSGAVVDINCRGSEAGPWYRSYTVTNPGATTDTGMKSVTIARDYQCQAVVHDWTSGTVSVTFNRYSN